MFRRSYCWTKVDILSEKYFCGKWHYFIQFTHWKEETAIFHTNIITTIHRSSLFLPLIKSSLLVLKFQTRTHTSRKWYQVIWQTDTNVAKETAASICSSQHPVKCFPWHCLPQNTSHLFSFLKSSISPP